MTPIYHRDCLPEGTFTSHRKITATPMIPVRGPAIVVTEEGPYELPEGWRGYIAIGAGGHPYPVSQESYDATYEPVEEAP